MHEQSETVKTEQGYVNVHGKRTEKAGQPLPKKYDYEKPVYDSLSEAVSAASRRSYDTGVELQQQADYGRSILGRPVNPKGHIHD